MTKILTAPGRPDDDASLADKTFWLLKTHGYWPHGAGTVVALYAPHADCLRSMTSFRYEYLAWREEREGPKGGIHIDLATSGWAIDPRRVLLAGIRMAPGRDFPAYLEDGEIYKNIYRRPQHPTGVGDVRVFVEFLERLIPDGREREWFYDWLAHKLRFPEIPGSCVIMVAAEEDGRGRYGTGRGMLFEILHKLFGHRYCITQDFNMIDGSSGQAIYNDWQHNCVLVTVNEARTSRTAHRRGERKSVYEVLKEVVDPRPRKMSFKAKYGGTFTGWTYASYIIAANHNDAMALADSDRRFTVLRNGVVMTAGQARELAAWTENDANIAALAEYLDVNLDGFNMYDPLETEAKTRMTELAVSPVEEAVQDLLEDDERGLVFTRHHFEAAVLEILTGGEERSGGHYWRGELEGVWKLAVRLLRTQGGKGRPVTIRINGRQVKLYAFASNLAKAMKLSESQRRTQAAKWGFVDGGQNLGDILSGKK